MEFIFANLELLISTVVIIVMLVVAVVTRQWTLVRVYAYQLMLSAQRLLATEEGQVRFEKVYNEVWDQLPGWIKTVVGKEKLREKLQVWYDLAKDKLKE